MALSGTRRRGAADCQRGVVTPGFARFELRFALTSAELVHAQLLDQFGACQCKAQFKSAKPGVAAAMRAAAGDERPPQCRRHAYAQRHRVIEEALLMLVDSLVEAPKHLFGQLEPVLAGGWRLMIPVRLR